VPFITPEVSSQPEQRWTFEHHRSVQRFYLSLVSNVSDLDGWRLMNVRTHHGSTDSGVEKMCPQMKKWRVSLF
jgi:hypothetical protein